MDAPSSNDTVVLHIDYTADPDDAAPSPEAPRTQIRRARDTREPDTLFILNAIVQNDGLKKPASTGAVKGTKPPTIDFEALYLKEKKRADAAEKRENAVREEMAEVKVDIVILKTEKSAAENETEALKAEMEGPKAYKRNTEGLKASHKQAMKALSMTLAAANQILDSHLQGCPTHAVLQTAEVECNLLTWLATFAHPKPP